MHTPKKINKYLLKISSFVGICAMMLAISCNTNPEGPNQSKDESDSEETSEVVQTNGIIEKLKNGNDRFVVLNEYDLRIFLPQGKGTRISARAVFDTETDVIEFTLSESGLAPWKEQFKIEGLLHYDQTYETYLISDLVNESKATLVLVENGMIMGPYPANLDDTWIVYCDFSHQKQVGEDLGNYFDQIEDLSFEVSQENKSIQPKVENKFEEEIKNDSKPSEKNKIHTSLHNFERHTYKIKTEDFLIRIDELSNNKFRYASWEIGKSESSKPDIILNNGVREYQGSGGNHTISFSNGDYNYIVHRNLIAEDGFPDFTIEVEHNNQIILSQAGNFANKK